MNRTQAKLLRKTVTFNMKTEPEFLEMLHALAKDLNISAAGVAHVAIRNFANHYRAGTLVIIPDEIDTKIAPVNDWDRT